MTALVVRVSMGIGELWTLVGACSVAGALIALLGVAAYRTRHRG